MNLRFSQEKSKEVAMSNNKQSMKLYTEDDLKEAFNFGRLYQGIKGDTNIYHLIDKLTPIELPSDEEIVNKALEIQWSNTLFKDGAKWMRDKIQGGNNEK